MMNSLSQISSLKAVSDCSGGFILGENVWVPLQSLALDLEQLPLESSCCWG